MSMPAVSPGASPADADAVFDLIDEVPGDEASTPDDAAIDLGEDLLHVLDAEPGPVAVHRPAAQPAPAQQAPAPPQASLRAVPQPSAAAEPIDVDEPIDLGVSNAPGEAQVSGNPQEISVGPLAPGEVQRIEVPVSVTIDGRIIVLQLNIEIRLPR